MYGILEGMYRTLIGLSCILVIGILLLNAVAHALYLYVSIPWFDMLMHTLGGVFIAIVAGALLAKKSHSSRELYTLLPLIVFVVGLGWEYYEYLVQFFVKSVDLAKIPDSISDLICDMVGSMIGSSVVILVQKRYNKE